MEDWKKIGKIQLISRGGQNRTEQSYVDNILFEILITFCPFFPNSATSPSPRDCEFIIIINLELMEVNFKINQDQPPPATTRRGLDSS